MIHLVLQPEITDDARQRAAERGILLGILSLVAPMCGPVFGIGGIFVAQWFLRPQTGFASLARVFWDSWRE